MPRSGEIDREAVQSDDELVEERRPELASDRPRYRPRGGRLKWGLLALVLILLAGGYFWLRGRNRESTDDAQVDGHIAQISAKIAGSVLQVLVDVNYHVEAGQV